MSRALLLCPEPVAHLTAGVGTRFLALAGVLARHGHGVTLAVPNEPSGEPGVPAGVELVRAEPERLGDLAGGHDWVLIHGHLGNHLLARRDDLPLVVDLYDPFLVDNLHYYGELGLQPYRTDHATWTLQMSRGDLFLCSSPEQRLYYLGWLTALGRVNPRAVEDDPTLERLIVELPFGVPGDTPPLPPDRADVLPGVGPEAPVLYFGGIYDWYDPLVVLDALPRILDRHADTVVVFVEHPHPDLTPQSVAARARRRAEEHGWLGTHVRFEPWRTPGERFHLPQLSDLAVVTHRPGLETELSLRTRIVDLLWLGLPVVATRGGAMSAVLEATGAGAVVPPGDPEALAAAVLSYLGDAATRREAAAAGRAWAADRTWDRVAEPLLRFAESPRRDPFKPDPAGGPAAPGVRDPLATRLLRRLGRTRKVER